MNTSELLDRFRTLKILIAGDLCLDRWCRYEPALREPSRETGIPRIGVVSTELTPGAAGTVANNLRALGVAHVTCLAAIGDDGHGHELRQTMSSRGISAELLIQTPLLNTFTYTKLINNQTGEEDQPRVDFVNVGDLPESIDIDLCERLRDYGRYFDAIIVSDQAETESGGVVTPRMRSVLTELAERDPHLVLWTDSRARPEHFRRVLLKINQQEAVEACQRAFGTLDLPRLRSHTDAPALIVTRGPEQVLLLEPHGEREIATKPVANPVDICGAGDSFTAGATCTYVVTRDAARAIEIGNRVAGITIMKKGTGVATPEELLAAEANA